MQFKDWRRAMILLFQSSFFHSTIQSNFLTIAADGGDDADSVGRNADDAWGKCANNKDDQQAN